MVNETTIYSSLQNLPYTTQIGIYNETTPVNFPALPAGRYEIKFAGTRVSGGSAVRQIQINETTVLDFQTAGHQETTFFVDLSAPFLIRLFNANETSGGNMSYQISWRRTPSLDLISQAEFDKRNQEIIQQLEIAKKEDHKKKTTSRESKDTSKGDKE